MIIQSCFNAGQLLKKILKCFVSANIKNPKQSLKSSNVILNILLPWQRTNQHIKSFFRFRT